MFKKRTNNKKIDLNQEILQIPVAQQPQHPQPQESSPQVSRQEEVSFSQKPSSKHRPKANFISLQALQKTQITETKPLQQEYPQIKKGEINDYLNQIRNFKPAQATEQENQQMTNKNHTMVMVEQKNGYNSEEYDDNELLEVEEDFEGGLSPLREQDNEYHEDYEDQLIKRTLTKQNYEQLRFRGGPILSDLKALEGRDRLLEKIDKVSAKKIQNTINKDLEQKRRKYEQIQQQLRMKKYSEQRQNNQIAKKEKRLEDLKKELEKVNSIIEYIYYYGDKINLFEKEAILKQIQNHGKPSMPYNFDDVE